jgi:hypothetical protein
MLCYKFIGLKLPGNQGFMDVWKAQKALALVYARNSFTMHTYEKRVRKFFRMHTCKFIGLKAPSNEHLQKIGGGGGIFPQWPQRLSS